MVRMLGNKDMAAGGGVEGGVVRGCPCTGDAANASREDDMAAAIEVSTGRATRHRGFKEVDPFPPSRCRVAPLVRPSLGCC